MPLQKSDLSVVANHLVAYHQPRWNASTAATIMAAYDTGALANATPAYKITRYGTDFAFLCNTRQAARSLAAAGATVWVYLFDYKSSTYLDPTSPLCERDSEVLCGVHHGQEVRYVFGRKLRGKEEEELSRQLAAWWTNLAIYGDPNGGAAFASNNDGSNDGSNEKDTVMATPHWPAYTATDQRVMTITERPFVSLGLPAESQCIMWDLLPR